MKIIKFFDLLEDRIRGKLSHQPIIYGLFGGVGIVLFWRGVWHTTDWISSVFMGWRAGNLTIDMATMPDGPLSFVIGSILLLSTGLWVSNFIGNEIIISGLRGEKKLAEKTEAEVKTETGAIGEIRSEIKKLAKKLDEIEKKL